MNYTIGIIGLGYVGLPLALAFSTKFRVIGYDVNGDRVDELNKGVDSNKEVEPEELLSSQNRTGTSVFFTTDSNLLSECNVYIITVPTPLDKEKNPDLSYLLAASQTAGQYLKKDDIVIYESTVYPGCTEEDCVPVLENTSGLMFNRDFFCGYSPERINPGDKVHTLTSIKKVVSGSTPEIAGRIEQLYSEIITAGIHKAPSIKVAEAAKAIENAQRDVNISFMNELALIFDRMGIDTSEVLEAASTKWNFLPFRPGLVGGHCIGVDPHYLAHKAMQLGYEPQVILSGRKVNEQMGVFVAEKVIALLARKHSGSIKGLKVLILGFAFKENCADTRNTKVIDIIDTLERAGLEPLVYDPIVDAGQVMNEYKINIVKEIDFGINAIILAVAHSVFSGIDFEKMKKNGVLLFDAKNFLPKNLVDGRL